MVEPNEKKLNESGGSVDDHYLTAATSQKGSSKWFPHSAEAFFDLVHFPRNPSLSEFQRSLYRLSKKLKYEGEKSARSWWTSFVKLTMANQEIEIFRNTADSLRRKFGGNSKIALRASAFYAYKLWSKGQHREAKELLGNTIEACQTRFGAKSKDLINFKEAYANWLEEEGLVDEARSLYEQAVESRRLVFGLDNLATLNAIENLGSQASLAKDFSTAQSHYREVLEYRRKLQGVGNLQTIRVLRSLAATLAAQGETLEAIELLKSGLVDIADRGNSGELDRVWITEDLSAALKQIGEIEESLRLRENVVEARRRLQGDDHPDTVASILRLGIALNQSKDYGRYWDSCG